MKIMCVCIRKISVVWMVLSLFIVVGCEDSGDAGSATVTADSSPGSGTQSATMQNSSSQSSSSTSSDSSAQTTLNISN